MKLKRFIIPLLSCMLICSTLVSPILPAAAYSSYSETFIVDAIDGTTRWASPIKNGSTYIYPTITSKWNEQRSESGTSPHVGIDVAIVQSKTIVAVTSGHLKKDTSADGQKFNSFTINTNHPTKNVYCHYEHCSTVSAEGYYQQGDQVGVGGEYGAPKSPHLHFGAYDTASIGTRKGYRNETLYRNAQSWNNGRNCDTFSVVGWLNDTTAAVTLVFSGKGNPHNEKPYAAQIYYRVAGDTSWTGPYNMTNSGSATDFTYKYDFSNLVSSGTEIQWVVRYRRSTPTSYMWAPAKYYNPSSDPNGSTNKWGYVTSTVRY